MTSITNNPTSTDNQDNNFAQRNNNGLMMALGYANASQVNQSDDVDNVALCTSLGQTVAYSANIKKPLLFRDGLLALFDVVRSDYRYVPKDRSAYTAFMQMRRSSPNKNLFTAQRQYFDWLFANDPLAYCILDPIVQVHQDGVSFEVFSRDESCYAQLTFEHQLFDVVGEIKHGTTHIDFSTALVQGIEEIRSYRNTRLDIGHDAVAMTVENPTLQGSRQIIEKRIHVPKSWIRSLLQVQSAMQLTSDSFWLDPVTLYNVLFELRMHADIKGKKRGLLIELIPQQAPVLTLEPFDISVKSNAQVYQGTSAKLVRLWGRRRLALIKKILPYCQSVRVDLLGQGMPSYWTLLGDGFYLTLAMTGFSQTNWSQALNFDLLLPKRTLDNSNVDDVRDALITKPVGFDELKKITKYKADKLHAILTELAQNGQVRYDVANTRYYYRPLDDGLDMASLVYKTLDEKHAYDLIARPAAISKFTAQMLPTQGVQLSADIYVSEDGRSYHSQLLLNEEGMANRAECSCPRFLQHRLSVGVCSHLIALRLLYAQHDKHQDKKQRYQQSRLFSKRIEKAGKSEQNLVQLTLNNKKIIIERTNTKARRQQLVYNTPSQAHHAFVEQIEHLIRNGFLENQGI